MEEVVRHYYSSERNPIGIEGDFYTAPDLDPIFGQLLAKQFDQWAKEFDSFTLVELGAGFRFSPATSVISEPLGWLRVKS